jgi:hypothetical protein
VGGGARALTGRILGSLAVAAALAAPAAEAHHGALTAAAPSSCAGAPDSTLTPQRVITGEFDTSVEGGYVLLPFVVPDGTTAVRVRYCHDQPEAPTNSRIKHVLDLGLYDSRVPGELWGEQEFRGWGGSSHPDVTVSRNGFSSEADYLSNPKLHRQGKTTRGFLPGPVPAGEWAVELGVAAVASQAEGDGDGKVAWRVEIDTSTNPLWESRPYVPAPYDSAPAQSGPGWYAGDFHVHGEHSALGDATDREIFDYAFAPLARDCGGCSEPGAGLDFITLSDYVTSSGWGEIGRFQADYPGRLIARSAEIITYSGHANNHVSASYVDYRTGPVYELSHGVLDLRRAARPASALFDGVHAGGGFTQINHPTIFPSQVPGFDFICRGCPWDYTDAETDYAKVDAVEIATGPPGLEQDPDPGPNPFTPLAIAFWEHAIDAGGQNSNHIAAVGSSDSHTAGRTSSLPDIPSAPVGTATTVVYAPELSERGIQSGVEAGQTYVKVFGNDGPDLRFEGRVPGSGRRPAIMGDTVRADAVDFSARVTGAGPGAARPGDYELFVLKDGAPLLAVPITSDDFTFPFPAVGSGRYRLQVQRGSAIEAVSSPIYVEPAQPSYPRPGSATPLRVPLVPDYDRCEDPSSVHVTPLALASCAPPALASPLLTTSAAGRGSGFARFVAVPGDPGTGGDEADVAISAFASDVSSTSGGSDYEGDVTVSTGLRVTDSANGAAGNEPGTVADSELSFPAECVSTPDPRRGATCSASTSADTLIPGFAQEGASTIMSIFSVVLEDAGPDAQTGSGDESPFLRQGIFLP